MTILRYIFESHLACHRVSLHLGQPQACKLCDMAFNKHVVVCSAGLAAVFVIVLTGTSVGKCSDLKRVRVFVHNACARLQYVAGSKESSRRMQAFVLDA